MHRFGCVAYLYTSRVGRRKLDTRGEQTIFLGYSDTQKVFVVYWPPERRGTHPFTFVSTTAALESIRLRGSISSFMNR